MDKFIKVRVSEEQLQDLEDHARDEDRPVSAYIRHFLVSQKAMRDHKRPKKQKAQWGTGTSGRSEHEI